ncbi:MAG TPA: FAD/NAD(P)-binding oxidoreductase [Terracidiphilus sp.]|nr:FAD/NAD(P)-binding oxidoreductase [Terracidiphilus sp.]
MRYHFDTLVIGAGPAGIAAAATAAECGARVGLVDDNPAAGGQIWRSGAHRPPAARQWLKRLEASRVVRLQGWRVFDSPQHGVLTAERTGGPVAESTAQLRFDQLILATGARERFLPFPGWTLPNVMGAGALDAMVRGGLPIAGRRVIVAGTGPLLLAVAAHLAARRARIGAVCEQAPVRQMIPLALELLAQPGKLRQGLQYRWSTRRSRYFMRCFVASAQGDGRLQSVTLRQGERQWTLDCDYLACGFHLVPNTELAALLGCRAENGFVVTDDLLQTSQPGVWCAGEPTGIGGVELSLLEGEIAGLAATGHMREAHRLIPRRHKAQRFVHALQQACRLNPQLRTLAGDDTIVCRCEDVRAGALRPRASWRDAKLHTRCGMGPCQGRICGGATEFLFGWATDSVRSPIFPARVSSLAEPADAEDTCFDNLKETV